MFQNSNINQNTHWLWPSARHLKEVTVTAFKWRSLEKWLADGQGSDVTWSDVTRNFWNFFFTFFGILGNFKRFHEKKFQKFWDVTSLLKWRADGQGSDVTWSDRHLKKVTSLLSSDEQMAKASIFSLTSHNSKKTLLLTQTAQVSNLLSINLKRNHLFQPIHTWDFSGVSQ